jgi:anti-sigma B factor antagonist
VEAPEPGFAVVSVSGDSDAYVVTRIRAEIHGAIDSGSPLAVDLSGASFVDSTVVGVLLEALARSEEHERPLLLLLPDDAAPEVHRLFEITGLASLLPLVRSWEEAELRLN